MEQTINERIIKITGSACIDKKLELEQDVEIKIKGSVVKVEDAGNNDGTKNRIFKVKLIEIEDIK